VNYPPTKDGWVLHLIINEILTIIQQAKEIEKQQIIDAINFGDERGKITTYKSAEQYYNETFK